MLGHAALMTVLTGCAGYCWWRTGSAAGFRVITEPTREERRRYWATNAAGLFTVGGALYALAPPLSPEQPTVGFVIDGRFVYWALGALFALLTGGGLVALSLSIAWIGGMVSPTRRGAMVGLEARAGQAAESWARRHPRAMVVVMFGFLVVSAVAMEVGMRRVVVADVESLQLGALERATPERVAWSQLRGVTIERTSDREGKRVAIVQFDLGGGQVESLASTSAWRLSDAVLDRIATFCEERGVAVTRR